MKLAKHPNASESARNAHDALSKALEHLGQAILCARLAGATPAVKGIAAAAVRITSWRTKLASAAEANDARGG